MDKREKIVTGIESDKLIESSIGRTGYFGFFGGESH